MRGIERLTKGLLVLFGLDRLIKTLLIRHFFKQSRPRVDPPTSISVIQPITQGVRDLHANLASRLRLRTTAAVQHLWVCDAADAASVAVCRAVQAEFPAADVLLLFAASADEVASKIEKINTALPHAHGDVLLFLDDDVALRSDALDRLLPYLDLPQVGAVFGLACYTNWRTLGSSALSVFVNANVLPSYIPITYFTDPFTITGHCFALRRSVFEQVGGFTAMEQRIDDDHELARRVNQYGLRAVQTPLIYDVDNDLATLRAYVIQMQRWFVLPRVYMLPSMTQRDQRISAIGSIGFVLPSVIGLLALIQPRHKTRTLAVLFALILAAYQHDSQYLGQTTPWQRRWLVPLIAVIAPIQAAYGALRGDTIQWRGQTLRLKQYSVQRLR